MKILRKVRMKIESQEAKKPRSSELRRGHTARIANYYNVFVEDLALSRSYYGFR